MTPNESLFVEVLAHVVAFPETWNQGDWITTPTFADPNVPFTPACGTAFCVAGYVAHLDGLRFVYDDSTQLGEPCVVVPNGTPVPVPAYAAERLGLTFAQSLVMFAPNVKTLDDLFGQAARLLAPLDEQVLRDKVFDRASQLRGA